VRRPLSSTEATAAAPDPSQGGHTANGITEALLTGDTASRRRRRKAPRARRSTAETDAEGAAHEAHMTKSDGAKATVKVNEDFSVASVEDGMR
jgi:hypothetical protein